MSAGTVPRAGRSAGAERTSSYVFGVVLLLAVALWVWALSRTHVDTLGETGLLSALPVVWYIALALALALCAGSICLPRVVGWRVGSAFLVLMAILYATSAKIEPVPRLPWVYKHIAVTRYIELHGSVNPKIDIYNRWPGFFSLAAYFGRITGISDPISYVAWTEAGFALAWAFLVFAIARSLSQSPRVCWTAALLFSLLDWIGQNYFSPQAFGFTLYLVVCLLALTYLRRDPRGVGGAVERVVARLVRRSPDAPAYAVPTREESRRHRRANGRSKVAAIVAIIVLQVVISVSHQLTPYLLVAGLIPLFVVGYLRPLWLGVVVAVIPVLYLIPNYSYIEQHFGLFSGYDPVANATYTVTRARPVSAAHWQAMGTRVLTAIAYLLALGGLIRRARSGDVRTAVMVAWLSFAPTVSLFSQSYGGEGRLRIVLFALPWLSVAASWLLWPSRFARTDQAASYESGSGGDTAEAAAPTAVRARPWTDHLPSGRNRAVVALVLVVVAAISVPTSLQPERDDQISPADVTAAHWLDSRVQPSDVVLTAAPNFPAILGPHYDYIVNTNGSLSGNKFHFLGTLNTADVLATIKLIGNGKGKSAYVVFSRIQQRFADEHGLFETGELASVEQGLTTSAQARKVYDRDGTRIFEISTN
ncbi:hypothetical protein M6D93_16475 [Jatrophihabitans telluris]|uniref:Glycosyltransferase RgtA/B/C/D-like domain-containing protein n=1 Tax=Jatrophihabitans telluris TaxID=2038343 RepID=A0ABY4QWZ3_9ACTN|nr:hypothetical protein [Jatrophihabitans telluris]UQX87883.1 hypothetical protein M6D93_16475 [Jatrophihabitans telluris]